VLRPVLQQENLQEFLRALPRMSLCTLLSNHVLNHQPNQLPAVLRTNFEDRGS
jgi:hypothetical protein